MTTYTLNNLPGKPGKTEAVYFKQARKAISAINDGYAATSSGDNGAINIWIDNKGKFRGERQEFCITKSEFDGSTIHELLEWVKSALKKIN